MHINFELKTALNKLKGDRVIPPLELTLGESIERYHTERQITKEKSLLLRNELVGKNDYAKQVMQMQMNFKGKDNFSFNTDLMGDKATDNVALMEQQNIYGRNGMVAATSLAIILGKDVEKYTDVIAQIAFGLDAVNTTIRLDLMGNYGIIRDLTNFGFELPTVPNFDKFSSLICYNTFRQGLNQLGQASMSQPYEWTVGNIISINPNSGCDGSGIHIAGTGFGNVQPKGVQIVFTAYNGGFIQAQRINSWSDTLITVTAPVGVGDGPIGFVVPGSGPGTTYASALGTLMGAAGMCLGMAAGRVVSTLGRLAGTEGMVVIRPTPNNIFYGGPPGILSFTGNGCSTPVLVRPNQTLVLSWEVRNATSIKIIKTGPPELPGINATNIGKAGTLNLGVIKGTVSWKGNYLLEATNTCGTVRMNLDIEMKERLALVLSGGGSKGDFQVGAVRCLYDVFGINPEIICGSSAGALNAVKLAEGKQSLIALEALWFSLAGPTDMFVPTHTVQVLLNQLAIAGLIPKKFQIDLSEILGIQLHNYTGFSPDVELAVASSKNILGFIVGSGLYFTISDILFNGLKVALALGKVFTALKRLIDIERSLFVFDPVRTKLKALVDFAKVKSSGIELRISLTNLDSSKTRYVNQTGVFVDNNTPVDLLDAVQASASIPIMYAPVALPEGNYVDGGLKENTAIESAEIAGASSIIAILASPVGIEAGDYSTSPLFPLLGRNVEIFMDESQRNDIFPFRGFVSPVKLIAPSFEVHNLITIDPGLIRINYDYGFNRAYDEFQNNDTIRSTLTQLSDAIARKRVEIWNIEHDSEGQSTPDKASILGSSGLKVAAHSQATQMVRDEKINLRALYERRILLSNRKSCQKGIEITWQKWEEHRWDPLIKTPWDDTSNHHGTILPQVLPPPAL